MFIEFPNKSPHHPLDEFQKICQASGFVDVWMSHCMSTGEYLFKVSTVQDAKVYFLALQLDGESTISFAFAHVVSSLALCGFAAVTLPVFPGKCRSHFEPYASCDTRRHLRTLRRFVTSAKLDL